MLVGDGAHDGAHSEAVEVVVNEDQHAQHDGGQLRPHSAFDVLGGPAAEGGGPAGLVHQADHSAQDDQEDQDAHIVAVRQHRDNTVLEYMEHGSLKLEAGIEQAAGQDADEQGGVNLLGDQGQTDGDHRGQQGKGGGVERADILRGLFSSCKGARGHSQNSHDQYCQQRQPVSFLSHFVSLHFTAWAHTAQFCANKKP